MSCFEEESFTLPFNTARSHCIKDRLNNYNLGGAGDSTEDAKDATIECSRAQIMVVHRGRAYRRSCAFGRPDLRLLWAAGPRVRTGIGQPGTGHDSGDIIR